MKMSLIIELLKRMEKKLSKENLISYIMKYYAVIKYVLNYAY